VVLSPFVIDRPPRAEILGCPVDLFNMQESVELIGTAMAQRQRLHHVAVNVAKVVNMRRDPALRRDVAESDLINVDGMGVVWGCRLLGLAVRERVTGIDLMCEVLALCQERGYRPYFLGAGQQVLETFIGEIRNRYPGLDIAGWRNGYFPREDERDIAQDISASGADCLFVAISSPLKERFLRTYRDSLDVPFLMGVGGAIDVLAGHVARAPVWMQRAGLEWLFRLAQEPRRLARRYLVSNTTYVALLAGALIGRAFASAPQQEESMK
jgi:N-acetylglucosaminyldiphosphoundecaprenol N-acetyl-beta-D-mannosaminyltransferase